MTVQFACVRVCVWLCFVYELNAPTSGLFQTSKKHDACLIPFVGKILYAIPHVALSGNKLQLIRLLMHATRLPVAGVLTAR